MRASHEAIVLGATGYVGGELLRLLTAHPHLELGAAISESSAGNSIGSVFPHLEASFYAHDFRAPDEIAAIVEGAERPLVAFSAASHGQSATLVARLLEASEQAGREVNVVDLSADFRYPTAGSYEDVYASPHGAPALLEQFHSGLPEHSTERPRHVGHPGCFTTATLLAIVPLLKLGLVEPDLYIAGITGSTGAGRSPTATTHHPLRHSNLFAYKPLDHRHVPEMTALAETTSGVRPSVHFIPHSGPFARGIHVTVQARRGRSFEAELLLDELRGFYREAPFVRVVEGTPKLKDVVGSNYCHLGAAVNGDTVAVFSVLDNLLKGAAGGAMQWMNRLAGFPETLGLTQPAPGWI